MAYYNIRRNKSNPKMYLCKLSIQRCQKHIESPTDVYKKNKNI